MPGIGSIIVKIDARNVEIFSLRYRFAYDLVWSVSVSIRMHNIQGFFLGLMI